MGVDPIPHVSEAQWLSDYRARIQQHLFDTTEAKALRTRLEEHFGNEHPVILECDRMIQAGTIQADPATLTKPEERLGPCTNSIDPMFLVQRAWADTSMGGTPGMTSAIMTGSKSVTPWQ